MQTEWTAYATRATHKNFGSMKVTHRSNHGHCRGILTSTGQAFECMTDNLTFPTISVSGILPPKEAKVQKPLTKREKKVATLSAEIQALLA